MRGGDGQQRFVFFAMAGESRFDGVECGRQRGQQTRAERRQPGAPLLADEQRRAQPLLKTFDLIRNGRLGHPQLSRGGGEILRPSGGFESPDGGKRRKASHQLSL